MLIDIGYSTACTYIRVLSFGHNFRRFWFTETFTAMWRPYWSTPLNLSAASWRILLRRLVHSILVIIMYTHVYRSIYLSTYIWSVWNFSWALSGAANSSSKYVMPCQCYRACIGVERTEHLHWVRWRHDGSKKQAEQTLGDPGQKQQNKKKHGNSTDGLSGLARIVPQADHSIQQESSDMSHCQKQNPNDGEGRPLPIYLYPHWSTRP